MSKLPALFILSTTIFRTTNARFYQGDVVCDEDSNACLGKQIKCNGCTVTCSGRSNSCNGAQISGAAEVICSGELNSCLGAEIFDVESIRCLGARNTCVSATLSASTIQCLPKINSCMGAIKKIMEWGQRPNRQKRESQRMQRDQQNLWPRSRENHDTAQSGSGSGSSSYAESESYSEIGNYEADMSIRRRRTFESMNNDLDGIVATIDKVRTANKLILDHVTTQDTAIGYLESQRMNLAQNIRRVYETVDELDGEISTIEAENIGYQRVISSQNSEIVTFSAQLESMTLKTEELVNTLDTLQKNLEESQSNYSALRIENKEMSKKVELLESKAKELTRKEELLDWAQKELLNAQRKDSELRKSFSEIQAALGNRDRL